MFIKTSELAVYGIDTHDIIIFPDVYCKFCHEEWGEGGEGHTPLSYFLIKCALKGTKNTKKCYSLKIFITVYFYRLCRYFFSLIWFTIYCSILTYCCCPAFDLIGFVFDVLLIYLFFCKTHPCLNVCIKFQLISSFFTSVYVGG